MVKKIQKLVEKTAGSYRHGNLREAILIASLEAIEKNGVDSLSIREVAKTAGVTHQAPYRHFKDKEALLAAIAQDGFEKLYQEMSKSVNDINMPIEKITNLGVSYLSWAAEHPSHFRLMFSQNIPEFESYEGLQVAANSILTLVLQVTEENQDEKVIRNDDTRSLARQFWATVHGVTLLFIDKQFKPFKGDLKSGQKLVHEIILNLINGLKPR
jgi:AcrR family transcriptional regulator